MKIKIVHLTLKEPYNGETDMYFTSIKAIYDIVPKSAMGITYASLINALNGKVRYENKMITVRVAELHRKASVKTRNKEQ